MVNRPLWRDSWRDLAILFNIKWYQAILWDLPESLELLGVTSKNHTWGHSSAGRAPAWHAGGQRFESAWLHLQI